MGTSDDDVHPIALLTEEIKSDEVETRIKAMRRLKTVAQALGAERTRSELVPFLREATEDEDEVLPLEVLAAVEETVVRDRAVDSLLKEGDWFTSRVSACSLFAAVYPKITDSGRRKELRDLFQILTNDDTPMVRRAAASNVGKFAATLEKEHITTLVIPLFKALTADDQDS
ncbi:hypothetical protein PINS_up024330, partial [Pythium insidiosum]